MMNMTHTLTRHGDIQAWVTEHKGLPAIRRMPDKFGEIRPRLALRFSAPAVEPIPALDEGISPVSWSAWLAELDRQHLGLRIIDQDKLEFEFIELEEFN
jgi:hypothetical protein